MNAKHRGGVEQVGDEIAVADGVDAVGRQAREAERLLQQHAGDGIGTARNGAGAERERGGGARGSGEAAAVAIERPEMREHPMCGGHRLGALQVRVRRHEGAGVVEIARMCDQDVLQRADRRVERGGRVHCPEAGGRGDLIVAAAAGMELGRDVADLVVEQPVDERVHVLVRGNRRGAGAEADGHRIEPALELAALLEREDAGVPERDGPGLGELDVERPEAEIDVDGAVERVEFGRGIAGEAAAPELVRRGAVQFERRHAIASAFGSGAAAAASRRAASSWSLSARTRVERP